MILDGHIHISLAGDFDGDTKQLFLEKASQAGVGGGLVISLPPASSQFSETQLSNEQRLHDLLNWCQGDPALFPFYWIDPLEDDTQVQIDNALAANISGFKVICNCFYPSDPVALDVFRYIAAKNRPILFHSGILWDGQPSSKYNMPAAFEALIEIPKLRFALAHISWPWCDEHIAVYGKFLNAYGNRKDATAEMFIDISPGTPELYRREALLKVFRVGYDVCHNVIFGSDSFTRNYNIDWVKRWLDIDRKILDEFELNKEALNLIYVENLRRFVGISKHHISRTAPLQGQSGFTELPGDIR
ncbi:MAG: amidohydrolase family protein [Sedimentisphaerales bacterium]|nr:amidohydrolase family protein [Sedimentisphaerales bacterium]